MKRKVILFIFLIGLSIKGFSQYVSHDDIFGSNKKLSNSGLIIYFVIIAFFVIGAIYGYIRKK